MSDRISLLKQAMQARPDDPFPIFAMSIELVRKAQDDEAEQLFSELIHCFPDYLPAYHQYALLLEKSGKSDLAALFYREGAALAARQGDLKTRGELLAALEQLEL